MKGSFEKPNPWRQELLPGKWENVQARLGGCSWDLFLVFQTLLFPGNEGRAGDSLLGPFPPGSVDGSFRIPRFQDQLMDPWDPCWTLGCSMQENLWKTRNIPQAPSVPKRSHPAPIPALPPSISKPSHSKLEFLCHVHPGVSWMSIPAPKGSSWNSAALRAFGSPSSIGAEP